MSASPPVFVESKGLAADGINSLSESANALICGNWPDQTRKIVESATELDNLTAHCGGREVLKDLPTTPERLFALEDPGTAGALASAGESCAEAWREFKDAQALLAPCPVVAGTAAAA